MHRKMTHYIHSDTQRRRHNKKSLDIHSLHMHVHSPANLSACMYEQKNAITCLVKD